MLSPMNRTRLPLIVAIALGGLGILTVLAMTLRASIPPVPDPIEVTTADDDAPHNRPPDDKKKEDRDGKQDRGEPPRSRSQERTDVDDSIDDSNDAQAPSGNADDGPARTHTDGTGGGGDDDGGATGGIGGGGDDDGAGGDDGGGSMGGDDGGGIGGGGDDDGAGGDDGGGSIGGGAGGGGTGGGDDAGDDAEGERDDDDD